jgi:hypothetical protein
MKKAVAIHVVEKAVNFENLTCLDSETNTWETKYWIIGKQTRKDLIGGKVYIHRGQNEPSNKGGTIERIYHPDEAELKRFAIVFRAEDGCNDVKVSKSWGNERKIEWSDL